MIDPEGWRGELGRLELRRILANMISDQYKTGGQDYDWSDPDMAITHDWRSARSGDNEKRVRDMLERYPDKWEDDRHPIDPSEPAYKIREAYNAKLKEYDDYNEREWQPKWNEAYALDHDDPNKWIEVPDTKWVNGELVEDGTKRIALPEHMANERSGRRNAWQAEIRAMLEANPDVYNGRSISWKKRYPEQMLADNDFVTFDPDDPDHQRAIAWANENKHGYHGYNEDYWPNNRNNASSIFPSLYYGLLPKDALKRRLPQHPYNNSSDVNLEAQVPDRRNVLPDWEKAPEEGWPDFELKPHPLAGKEIMEQYVSGFANPDKWELVENEEEAMKKRRFGEYGTDGRKSNVIRSPLDQEAEIQRIMADKGIDRQEALWNLHSDEHAEEGFSYKTTNKRGLRERPQKLEKIPEYLSNPVTRAIAQAFMDKEMEQKESEATHIGHEMDEKNPDDIGAGSFGSDAFGSEYKEKNRGWNNRGDKWDLGDFMSGKNKADRKPLNEILDEINERRLKERGFNSWDELDDALELEVEED